MSQLEGWEEEEEEEGRQEKEQGRVEAQIL